MDNTQSTETPPLRPTHGKKITFTCATCGKLVTDYASNRKKTSTGNLYCSAQCRIAGTRTSILVQKDESMCVRCGLTKPLSEFYADKTCKANGGVQYTCKDCTKKLRMQHYDSNTDRVIARATEYAKEHPEVAIRHGKKQRAKETKEQRAARRFLNAEVRRGNVHKPDACQKCGKQVRLYGHHRHGYEKQFWTDVEWLCGSCHHAAHGRGPQSRPRIDEEDVLIVRKP